MRTPRTARSRCEDGVGRDGSVSRLLENRIGVAAGGVHERDRKIIAGEHERDLGAAQDDGVRVVAFDMTAADRDEGFTKLGRDLADGEILVDRFIAYRDAVAVRYFDRFGRAAPSLRPPRQPLPALPGLRRVRGSPKGKSLGIRQGVIAVAPAPRPRCLPRQRLIRRHGLYSGVARGNVAATEPCTSSARPRSRRRA
jgi:hypothetical protein